MGEGSKRASTGPGLGTERRREKVLNWERVRAWEEEMGKIMKHVPVSMPRSRELQFGETHGDQVNCCWVLELSSTRHGGLSLSWYWVEVESC